MLALLLVGGAAVAVLANKWKSDLRVVDVQVKGNQIIPGEEIISLAGIKRDDRLFDIDLFAAQARVLKNTFIRAAAINRDVPGGISITVEERSPLAAVVLDQMYYLDADGFVLPPVRSENIFDLPVLTGTIRGGELAPGRQVSNGIVREALVILKTAQQVGDELYRCISEVHINGAKDIVLYTAEYGVPVIFGRGDVAAKMVKFDGFWHQVVRHHGVRELHYIDLRFEGQVVVRWKNTGEESKKTNVRLTTPTKEHPWTTS